MHGRSRLVVGGVALLAIALGALSWRTGVAGPHPAPATAATATAVTVKLGSPSEFKMEVSPTTVPPGDTQFNASNVGTIAHELVIIKTDRDIATLPARATDPNKVDEEASGQVMGEIEDDDLPAGASANITLNLPAGKYALICNVAGHYKAGMFIGFTAAAQPSPTPSPAPTATPSPAPTATPSPAPTATAAPTPAPTATAVPVATPRALPPAGGGGLAQDGMGGTPWLWWALLGAGGSMIAMTAFWVLRRSSR
ncbi:MAG TPA: cupredoxin domain-containing protein [Dehalococcoidia bacterium]|nr:cupredoxin domain-containing protein [Dehalococcoidia bacterium]